MLLGVIGSLESRFSIGIVVCLIRVVGLGGMVVLWCCSCCVGCDQHLSLPSCSGNPIGCQGQPFLAGNLGLRDSESSIGYYCKFGDTPRRGLFQIAVWGGFE